jgi:hypothetical protein
VKVQLKGRSKLLRPFFDVTNHTVFIGGMVIY